MNETSVRFGCGLLFGILLGVLAALRLPEDSGWVMLLGLVGGIAIACGLLAAKYGDRFWTWRER